MIDSTQPSISLMFFYTTSVLIPLISAAVIHIISVQYYFIKFYLFYISTVFYIVFLRSRVSSFLEEETADQYVGYSRYFMNSERMQVLIYFYLSLYYNPCESWPLGVILIQVERFSKEHGRRGGLMVSALDSGLGGPGSSPGRATALCSWARHFTLVVPLSTQVYKWVPANFLLGVTLRWISIPSRGE